MNRYLKVAHDPVTGGQRRWLIVEQRDKRPDHVVAECLHDSDAQLMIAALARHSQYLELRQNVERLEDAQAAAYEARAEQALAAAEDRAS